MRAVGAERLMAASGLKRTELAALLDRLQSQELLVESRCDAVEAPLGWFDRWRKGASASPWNR